MYSVLCSAVCTVELLILCLATGTPLFTFSGDTWLALLGLLIFPQLLGLFSLNFVLGRAPATSVSVLLLLEAPVAAFIAWLWLDQLPDGSTWPGLAVIMLGVAWVVVADARRADPMTRDAGGTRDPAPLAQHPPVTSHSAPGGDTHTRVLREAYAGRFTEAEATVRELESQAIRAHGVKSPQATHWTEVRAAVARIAGDHALAARLWLTAARFHSSLQHPNLHMTRVCLDHAFHEWGNVADADAVGALAPVLREMYAKYPFHRPEAIDALDRRLRRMALHPTSP